MRWSRPCSGQSGSGRWWSSPGLGRWARPAWFAACCPDITTFAVRGGFPELHEKPELDGAAFHRSYVTTYLERDVRALLNVGSLRDFERFLRAGRCARRSC